MSPPRAASNTDELKANLGPLAWAEPVFDRFFKVRAFDAFLERIHVAGRPDFFTSAMEQAGLSNVWSDQCLARIPRKGPLVVVANHPHGLADGLVAMDFLLRARPDTLVVGNRWLSRIPGIRPWLIEVNPFSPDASDPGNIAGTRRILAHLRAGGCVLTFPAGEVSSLRLRSRRVDDPVWSPQVVRMARMVGASLLPLRIEGRNSGLFQSLGLVHPRLRTMLLLREFLQHHGKVIRLRTANPVTPTQLADHPDDEEATSFLRLRCELLASRPSKEKAAPAKPAAPQAPIIPPVNPSLLRAELQSLPPEDLLLTSGDFKVYRFLGKDLPHTLREIGRLRETTFRSVSEGTGLDCDLDAFDAWYDQIVLWDDKASAVVGGYRLGPTDRILPLQGKHGLYASTLFEFKGDFFRRMDPALEMGRSFIRQEYQRKPTSLPLLWRGIGRYVVRFPKYHLLFGPVSINPEYGQASKELILSYLKNNRSAEDLLPLVRAKNPPRSMSLHDADLDVLQRCAFDLEHVSSLVSDLEPDAKAVPVLLKHYLKLNGRLIAFNVDEGFGGCLDGLIVVDLTQTDPKLLAAYMGDEGARHFLEYHDFDAAKVRA
ncbi:MAG: lysophospholipid acyltransferase family protein [Opitutales bacterium]